jgi:peptide-methionine (R)-S-oxide reductase
MRTWVLLLLALPVSGACGQIEAEVKVSDKQPQSSAKAAGSGSQDAKPEAAGTADRAQGRSGTEPADKVVHTEQEWRKLLSPEQFEVLRMKGTERPFRNKYDRHFEPGCYACAACGQELFRSETKFNAGCGWPAFYAAMAGDRVMLSPDHSHGMVRTEVTCARCGSHLGHLFDDAPQTPTGQRFCINSVSLKFIPATSKDRSNDQPSPGREQPGDSSDK